MSGHTKITLEIDYGKDGGVRRYQVERATSELTCDEIARMARSVILAAEFEPRAVEELFHVD